MFALRRLYVWRIEKVNGEKIKQFPNVWISNLNREQEATINGPSSRLTRWIAQCPGSQKLSINGHLISNPCPLSIGNAIKKKKKWEGGSKISPPRISKVGDSDKTGLGHKTRPHPDWQVVEGDQKLVILTAEGLSISAYVVNNFKNLSSTRHLHLCE